MRFVVGLLLLLVVLIDSFESVVLPRTVRRPIRLTTIFFLLNRAAFKIVSKLSPCKLKQALLVSFAPVTMIALIGFWAVGLVVGFALMESGIGVPMSAPTGDGFINRLYFSGVTFFTIGYGDITPANTLGKMLAVIEGGMGLGFLAIVIGYVPVFYQAFSRREVTILLLDSRAGSDPTGSELIRRYMDLGSMEDLIALMRDWEVFSAQLLEAYLSYPILAFYRSQHDDQSWLRSLCAIMDACAIIEMGFAGDPPWQRRLRFQAKATFAMARHVVVDLSYVLNAEPVTGLDRLPGDDFDAIARELSQLGFPLDDSPESRQRLIDTRTLYEPYLEGLSKRLMMDLPRWLPEPHALDNWQTSAWEIKHF